VIGRNGEVVSNYHVFAEGRNTNVVAIGAMTRDGRCFPIQEVLAADRERDVAIVRIAARDLVPLAVSPREPVGSPISVIAHPSGELFTFTQGHISRYMRKTVESGGRPMDWMTVTADFAVGSSGGPVFNRHGAVVGMVARTHTINADPKSESPTTQMVVKMTIPSEDILSLIESGKGRATTTKERR
jgi:S1-C subfamily serine protease